MYLKNSAEVIRTDISQSILTWYGESNIATVTNASLNGLQDENNRQLDNMFDGNKNTFWIGA
jgi:hypothetical protein